MSNEDALENEPLFDFDERVNLYKMASIASQMPINLKRFGTLTDLHGTCPSCYQQIVGDQFRGLIDRSFPTVTQLNAVGICSDCEKAICFSWRIYDDGRLLGHVNGQWIKGRIHKKATFKSIVNKVLFALFPIKLK